ncbi:MAG: TIGR00266 family protein [Polyangiaceae bacterium]|nr:TIGR00266 family protein [Polyangiaceae bacterium]
MHFDILQKPDFSLVRLVFEQPGEQLLVESAAMVARDSAIQMSTHMQGGLLGAAKRKLLGGESVFQNTFTATASGQQLYVAPGPEGDVEVVTLDGRAPLYLSSGAFLASAPTVQLDAKWHGAKGLFSGLGLSLLMMQGVGPLFFCAYGGIHAIDVPPQGYVVDTTHIVGFTAGLEYSVQKVGGLKSLFFSGEGLVCRFSGQGRLWISTRNPGGLGAFLQPFRRSSN